MKEQLQTYSDNMNLLALNTFEIYNQYQQIMEQTALINEMLSLQEQQH